MGAGCRTWNLLPARMRARLADTTVCRGGVSDSLEIDGDIVKQNEEATSQPGKNMN